ncbi:hypothetical protein ETAA8_55130 [Anatilimnocola aggregata]|uniref:Uncharacterized protein n=1 Tax=Anatilimnocola aggregata TaxID=2528021 RepID=A0A517YJJ7_9BACT|nr:hypothetical protein [Anatilimnocola aggregata]QDU30385.1 hypothetical protein ETAA8_55130 [Anatilimnocola aggregata]
MLAVFGIGFFELLILGAIASMMLLGTAAVLIVLLGNKRRQ